MSEPAPPPGDPTRALAWIFRETALFGLSLLFRVYPEMEPAWWRGKGRKAA